MAGGVPKSKAVEITERINELAATRAAAGAIDEWTWHLLKKDIDSLGRLPEFAAQSLIFEAIVWSLASNIKEMERCFNLYAGRYGKDWSWHRARAMQGPALGRTDMVMDMLKAGYPIDNASDLHVVAHVCNQAGLFYSSALALKNCLRLNQLQADSINLDDFSHLQDTIEYMQDHDLDEDEISRRISVASQVVIEMSGPLTTFSVHTNESGIMFEYTVDDAIDRLVEIDFAITRKLVSCFEDTMSSHMSIAVTPPAEDESLAS